MTKATALKLSASSAIVALSMIGCTPSARQTHVASNASVAPVRTKDAAASAARARKAITERDGAAAVLAAERAVAAAPNDAGYRATLGNAYFIDGRFFSAETALRDALTLAPADGRTTVRLALTQIGRSDYAGARATLSQAPADTPQADLGLAFALAGDAQAGVALLDAAARAPGADARVRQNLALAYAFAGRWIEARATATQDLPAGEVNAQLLRWASMANARAGWEPLAALLDIKPQLMDPGQPTRLALLTPSMPTAVAAVGPAHAAGSVTPAPQPVTPSFATAPAARNPTPDFLPQPAATRALAAVGAPAVAEIDPVMTPASSPTLALTQTVRQHAEEFRQAESGSGGWAVQLGAYSTESRVEAGWKGAVGQYGPLSSYLPASTTYAVRSLALHRLSIAGLPTRAVARSLCLALRARGSDCFVRAAAGDAPLEWAQRLRVDRQV